MGKSKFKNNNRDIPFTRISLRLQDSTYRDLLRIKVKDGHDVSFNNYLNGILAKYVNRNIGILAEHKEEDIDYSDFD